MNDPGLAITDWLLAKCLDQNEYRLAFRILDRLYRRVRSDPTVAYYEETKQDIDHVLTIFIRRNSKGTDLAYSDLLLSIAVSQWEERDARREVFALVDELNAIGSGLDLSKDFVLKAGLILFPFINVRDHHFHIDHVFPKSLFTRPRLHNAGVNEEEVDSFMECVNRVGNFQLMDGVMNNEKRAKLPTTWIREHFEKDEEGRKHYQSQYVLDELPENLNEFSHFYNTRRRRLRDRIEQLVNADV